MFEAIARVITSPTAFFRELAENERLKDGAVWVVLLTTLVYAVATYFQTLPQLKAFPQASALATITLTSALVGVVIMSLLSWAFFGLIIRMAAGMEAKPWAVAGYSTAPNLIIGALMLLVAVFFTPDITPITRLDDPQALQTLQRQIAESPQGIASTVLGNLSMAWYLVLVFLGVRETTGMTHRATRTVIIIGLIYAAFALSPWLFTPLA